MKKFNSIDLVDINKKKGFPRTYKFNPFARWFTIILALSAIAYAVWYIISGVDADTTTIKKIIPFVIIFLAANSLFRNLFSLNSITFNEDYLKFGYILSNDKTIKWDQIVKISLYSGKSKAIVLKYNSQGDQRQIIFTMIFPNMIEIINSIAEICPQTEFDTFMENIIISKTSKNRYHNSS